MLQSPNPMRRQSRLFCAQKRTSAPRPSAKRSANLPEVHNEWDDSGVGPPQIVEVESDTTKAVLYRADGTPMRRRIGFSIDSHKG